MRTRSLLLCSVLMLSTGLAATAAAAESKTLTGEIVDPSLYLREGQHGSAVEETMYEAVDAGQTLALLEDGTQTLYLFIAGEPGGDPNDAVYDYVGKHVTITGSVYERGGLKGLVAEKVAGEKSAAVPQPPAQASAPAAKADARAEQ